MTLSLEGWEAGRQTSKYVFNMSGVIEWLDPRKQREQLWLVNES